MDATGRLLTVYELSKKGALLLASGYNTDLRYKILNRLEKLEEAIQKTTPVFWGTKFEGNSSFDPTSWRWMLLPIELCTTIPGEKKK